MAYKSIGAVLLLGTVALANGLVPLRIQVLVPKENPSFSAESTLPAMDLAVDDINDNSDLLNDYNFTLVVTDTRCDPPEGTWQLISTQMKYDRQIQMVFGGGCSLVTEPTAALTSRFYETIQVAYAASSPVLSDRQMYRYFFRVNPSETISNILRFALMKKYNWIRVATLHQTRNLFSRTVEHFYDNLKILGSNFTQTNESSESADNDGATLFSFTDDPDIPLTQIKDKNIRIVFGFMYEDKAVIVMCYAYHMGLNTINHQWVMPGWYSDNWWDKANNVSWEDYKYNCTSEQIQSMVNHSLLLDAYLVTENLDEIGISGRDYYSFNSSYQKRLDEYYMVPQHRQHLYAGVAYDGLWAIALTLNQTEAVLQEMNCSFGNLTGCPSMNRTTLTKMFFNFMNTTSFSGASGHVRFDQNGTRIGTSALYQYQPILPNGRLEKVLLAVHDEESDQLVLNFTSDPMWEGGRPPADRSTSNSRFLSKPLIYISNIFVSFGIIVSLAMFIFNVVTIRKPLIANSAPIINAVIIIGCIMLLVACYLLGIDSGTPQVDPNVQLKELLSMIDDYSKSRYAIICTVRLWILTVGFTLSFGALFAKTWQAYRIYTTPSLKSKPFKYYNFLVLMVLQLFVDANFLWVWTAFFNFTHEIENKENTETDVVDKYELCQCNEFPYLIGALYVYKGLMVIFGLFLAYESRNVKYYYLNDSRFVSVAMYLVVILIGITAPLSLVLSTQFFIDAAYGLSVFMIVLAVLSCLLVLFIPKFVYMAKGLDTMLPAVKTETFTPVDGLQLGRTEVNPDDLESADKEIKKLEKEVQQKEHELDELQRQNRRGSDDSGVHCISETIDSNSSAHTPDNFKEPAEHFGAKEP